MTVRTLSRHSKERSGERGAALLVVLLMVAVMSIVAVAASEAVSHAARRGANVAARSQAVWYLLGAEELARVMLARSHDLDPDRTTLNQPWAAGQLRFPVDGGVIEGELVDASNCFNVNSLARPRGRGLGYAIDEEAQASLLNLARAVGADAGTAQRLADGAADWIDADSRARGYGAEDYDYAFAKPPYRAANGLFTEVEELRAVSGVTEGAFRAVRPYLCAREAATPSRLNLNTLREADAPLLANLFDGDMSLDDAAAIIAARPNDGWSSREEFWALERVQEHPVDEAMKDRVGVRASHFLLSARVGHRDAYVEARTLFRQGANGEATVVRRTMGDPS